MPAPRAHKVAAVLNCPEGWKASMAKETIDRLGPVDIHFNAMTAAVRLIMAAKL